MKLALVVLAICIVVVCSQGGRPGRRRPGVARQGGFGAGKGRGQGRMLAGRRGRGKGKGARRQRLAGSKRRSFGMPVAGKDNNARKGMQKTKKAGRRDGSTWDYNTKTVAIVSGGGKAGDKKEVQGLAAVVCNLGFLLTEYDFENDRNGMRHELLSRGSSVPIQRISKVDSMSLISSPKVVNRHRIQSFKLNSDANGLSSRLKVRCVDKEMTAEKVDNSVCPKDDENNARNSHRYHQYISLYQGTANQKKQSTVCLRVLDSSHVLDSDALDRCMVMDESETTLYGFTVTIYRQHTEGHANDDIHFLMHTIDSDGVDAKIRQLCHEEQGHSKGCYQKCMREREDEYYGRGMYEDGDSNRQFRDARPPRSHRNWRQRFANMRPLRRGGVRSSLPDY